MRPRKIHDEQQVHYKEDDWARLEKLRGKAKNILNSLANYDIFGLVHGSIARGDVKKGSDIDIITPYPTKSFKVELSLKEENYTIFNRKIVMATPWQLPKAHISLEKDVTITVPLEKPKMMEKEFYYFGGAVDLEQVEKDKRVPGVDKRLVLIEPKDYGHLENQVVGREGEVAKKLDISQEIVEERVEVLTKRNNDGRTGIFLERKISSNENFENVWDAIVSKNPEVSKRF